MGSVAQNFVSGCANIARIWSSGDAENFERYSQGAVVVLIAYFMRKMARLVRIGNGMPTPKYITYSIKRLCDLETGSGSLSAALSEWEKRFEIARLRSIIPAAILGHHDRMLQRGKRTILPVLDGICPACDVQLTTGQLSRLRSSQDLEVCDSCGTFIYYEKLEAKNARTKPIAVKRKRELAAV